MRKQQNIPKNQIPGTFTRTGYLMNKNVNCKQN